MMNVAYMVQKKINNRWRTYVHVNCHADAVKAKAKFSKIQGGIWRAIAR